MNYRTNLSEVMHTAHELYAKTLKDWNICVRLAWKRSKLKRSLKQGPTMFTKTNKDGSSRVCKATTNADLFEYEFKGKSVKNRLIVKYYDLERERWGSTLVENL